jgi:hypothetical protein
MNARVTRSKTLFMASYKPLFGLALAMLLGSCVYVPPPEYYGGPPPPPDVPPPYHLEPDGPPPPDYYFGRGRARRSYEFDYERHRRGRTQYLREVDPDYAADPVEDVGAMPPEDAAGSTEPPDPSASPSPPPAPAPKLDPASVPYGTKTSTPGRAKSPYPPYRELDVSGMRSGSMAKDPTTGKVFRVP